MKNRSSLLMVALLGLILSLSSCTKKKDPEPCDNKGTLCLENKMDSSVTVFFKPINSELNLQRDYMKCKELAGNQPYTLTISTAQTSRDTTIFILPCDNKLFIIR